MMEHSTRPRTVHDQLTTLAVLAGKIRAELGAGKVKLPKELLEQLHFLQTTLETLGGKMETFQREHGNMLALVETGQVINSSLELDEVLRCSHRIVVMRDQEKVAEYPGDVSEQVIMQTMAGG